MIDFISVHLPRRRRILALLGLAAAALLTALALGLFPQDPVRRQVEARLRALVGPGAQIRRLAVEPARLRATVEGLVLDAPGYRLEVDHLQLVLAAATLRGHVIHIRDLKARGVRLLVRPAPPAAAGPAPPKPPPLWIDALAVDDGSVRYQDPSLRGEVVLDGVSLRGAVGNGALDLTASGGRWRREPEMTLAPVRARLRIDPQLAADLESFEAGLPRSHLRASGRIGPLLDPSPDLRVQATVDLDEVGHLGGLQDTRGTAHIEGTVKGARDLRLTATVTGEALRLEGWPVEKIALQLEHGPERTSGSLEASLLDGRAQGEGSWDGARLAGQLQLTAVSLARLRQAGVTPPEGLQGRVDASLGLNGPRERAQLTARAQFGGRLDGGPALTAHANAHGPISLADRRVDLAWDAVVDAQGQAGRLRSGRLEAAGRARGPWPPLVEAEATGTVAGLGAPLQISVAARGARIERLTMTGDGLDLDALVPGLHGRARLTATASGPLAALDGSAELEVAETAWREARFGPASAKATLRRGRVDASLALPDLHARATVSVPPGARAVAEGTVELTDTPLAPLAPLLPPAASGLRGTLRASATFAVPLASPAQARGAAQVEALEASRGRWSARAAGPFRVAYAPGEVTVEALQLESDGLHLEADGRVGTAAGGPLDLRLRARSSLDEAPVPEGWQLTGKADADVSVAGTLERPQGRGHLALRQARVSGPGVPAVTIEDGRLELAGTTLVLPAFTAGLAGGRVVLDGRVPLAAVVPGSRRARDVLAPEEEAAVRVEWSEIDAATLLSQAAPGRGEGLDARLSGRAEVRGGFASLAEPSVVVELPPLQARFQEVPLALAAATVELRGGRLSTAGLRLATESGSFDVTGHADLLRRQAELTGRGELALRALSPLLREVALNGTAQLDVDVRGPFDALRTEGALTVQDTTVRLRAIPQALSGLSAVVVFEGGRLRIEDAHALLGGGPVTLGGTARLEGTRLEDARFTVTGRDLAVRYPAGLRTRLDADVTLTGRTGAFLLAGTVRAQRGQYDLDAALRESTAATAAGESPALRTIGLDLTLVTERPIAVRSNNLGEMRASGRLVIRGDMETPAPVGRIAIERGGIVFLQGQEFQVTGGDMTYTGNWNPTLAINAERQITDEGKGGTQVTVMVKLEGTLEKPALTLGSQAGYSESEIISLIAVGNSQDRTARLSLGAEAATFLLGSRLSRSLRGLGFDEVSVQPELVAREGEGAEAGARFTFGKRLSRRTKLVYSLSLQDPEARFIKIQAEPGWNVTVNALRTDAGTNGAGAGQTFRWGAPQPAGAARDRSSRLPLREVRLEGDLPLEPGELRRLLKVKEGDRRSIWQLQDNADRLRAELVKRGYVESEVDVRLEAGSAVFQVRTGPHYTWEVTGMPDPPDIGDEIRHGLFEEEALENGRQRLLSVLRQRGHLRAAVAAEVRPRGEGRLFAFEVVPGPRLDASLSFPGATAFREGQLSRIAGGPGRVLAEPETAVEDLQAAYRARHYLAAKVEPPRVTENAGRVEIAIPIHEGPRAPVAAVRFQDATRPEEELRAVVKLTAGQPYDDGAVTAATDALRAHYFGLGFPAVRVSARAVPSGPGLEVVFQIAEGGAARVGSVVIQGATRTRPGFIRDQIQLQPGDPVDPRALSKLEKRLLDLGLFSRVAASVSSGDPATVTVTVEEGHWLEARYLLRYDEALNAREEVDTTLRGDLDAAAPNLFGRGLLLGGRYGLGTDVDEQRVNVQVPALLGQERLGLSLSRLREELEDPIVGPSRRVQREVHLYAQRAVFERWRLLYGYRFKRTELKAKSEEFDEFDIVANLAGLNLSAIYDSRDNALDARRGRFFTFSLEYAPPVLGKVSGDFKFVKGLAQLSLVRPLGDSLTWAQQYRLGLAHGFKGQPVIGNERFKAGGANTVRGFATNRLGPLGRTPEGELDPLGGEAVVVLNQELRYRHPSGLGGVVFWDAGEVFPESPSLDLRHALGFGLRWESPIGLVRLDLGFPLRRQADREERNRQLFISIGQAF